MELRVLSTRPWICLEGEDPAHWLASIWDRSIQRQTFVPASSSHLSRSVLDWLRNTWPRSRINLIPNLSRPLSSLPSSPTSHVDVSSKTSLQPNPTFPEYVGPPTLPVFALFQSFSVFFFPSLPFSSKLSGTMAGRARKESHCFCQPKREWLTKSVCPVKQPCVFPRNPFATLYGCAEEFLRRIKRIEIFSILFEGITRILLRTACHKRSFITLLLNNF